MKLAAAALALVLLGAGCSSDDEPDDAAPTTTTTTSESGTTPAPSSTSAGAGAAPGSIAEVDFRNFTYGTEAIGTLDPDVGDVTVVDGEYSSGEPPDVYGFGVVDVDLGDFDGDGAQEAAVSIYFSTGGTGQFTDVLVYRWSGGAAEYVTGAGVGDRGDDGVDDVTTAPAGGVTGDVLVIRRNADADGACCPTALEERTFRLRDDELAQVGDPDKWAIVRIGVDDEGNATDVPTEIEFLPGTSRAELTGDATSPIAATFDATAGQTLQLTIPAGILADNALVATVTGPGGATGRVGSGIGDSLTLELPATGSYSIRFEPVAPVDPDLGVFVSAQLRIL